MSYEPRYDKRRFVCEVNAIGDEIQVTKRIDGCLSIEISEPWAGDTSTGFGATASVTLSESQASALIKWISGMRARKASEERK